MTLDDHNFHYDFTMLLNSPLGNSPCTVGKPSSSKNEDGNSRVVFMYVCILNKDFRQDQGINSYACSNVFLSPTISL